MKKKFTLLFLLSLGLFKTIALGQKIEIKSQNVLAEESKGTTTFTGAVSIIRDKDKMKADKVVVFLNKKKEIDKFEANGNTSFILNLESNQTFKGKSDNFIYKPIEKKFILWGHATVEDLSNQRKLIGEKIILDEQKGTANIQGKPKEPVKVIFNLAEKKENKDE